MSEYKPCLTCYYGKTGKCQIFHLKVDKYDVGTCHTTNGLDNENKEVYVIRKLLKGE